MLENYHKEDVMLACVLDDKETFAQKFRFLEIDINSKFFVSLVADEHRLFKKARVQKALRNCHADSEKWCQQLKVIHHIYPSKNQNAVDSGENNSNKPARRARKLSLGDKKTVKSASFRYSTSYGADEVKPPYRNLPPADVYQNKATNQTPPVYLNIANKPNEENCSSLPTQKSDRSAFENEILLSVIGRQNGAPASAKPAEPKTVKERPPKERHRQLPRSNNAGDSSYHKVHERELVVTSHETNRARVTKSSSGNNVLNERTASKFNDLRYRVIKKENTYVERDLSNVPRQPIYKTQVMVKIDDSYSDAIDAIKLRRSSKDNIYAEINEYQSELSNANFVIFPQKSSCFVNDNCSGSYIRVPSTSTVNVS